MSIFIWLLTAFLVVDCFFLMLLVLIQLPKKEAGLGQAFGSGTTDALFGAGTGNVLTKLTKYSTAIFFIVTLSISILQGHQGRARTGDPRLKLTIDEKLSTVPKTAAAPATAPGTNSITLSNLATNPNSLTNLLKTATNAAAAASPTNGAK